MLKIRFRKPKQTTNTYSIFNILNSSRKASISTKIKRFLNIFSSQLGHFSIRISWSHLRTYWKCCYNLATVMLKDKNWRHWVMYIFKVRIRDSSDRIRMNHTVLSIRYEKMSQIWQECHIPQFHDFSLSELTRKITV